jgi:hypothetical protein
MSEAVDLAVRLNILKRGLPPRELQTAAMLLLSDVAQAAEAAPDPVSGVSVIHNIAAIACKHFAERRTDTAKPPYTEFGKGNTNYDEFGQGAANYDLHEHLMRQLAGQSERESVAKIARLYDEATADTSEEVGQAFGLFLQLTAVIASHNWLKERAAKEQIKPEGDAA